MNDALSLGCPECEQRFSIEKCLAEARHAWPNQSWIGFTCPACGATRKLEVGDGTIAIGDIDGAPGPCFFPDETVSCPGLTVKVTGMFILCMLDGKKFSFSSRQRR